jgi:hypothetical protein
MREVHALDAAGAVHFGEDAAAVLFLAENGILAGETVVVSAGSIVAAEHFAGFARIEAREQLDSIEFVDELGFVGQGGDGLEQHCEQKAGGSL